MSDANKTLYVADRSDPRARAASPEARPRGRAAPRAAATSDLRRFRGVLAAAITGAAATIAAALLLPPPGGHLSPGPLSLPHARAGLSCQSCHQKIDDSPGKQASTSTSRVSSAACERCHGAHPSTRPGHARAQASGAMRCATCHAIHRSDQGVLLSPSAAPLRFAPGVEASIEAIAYRPPRPATVAIPTAESCAGCHDLASPRDPIARCLVRDHEALGPARPIVCFDEHEPALPPDGIRPTKAAARLGARGVCAAQHGSDRALAWEAAREAALRAPALERPQAVGAPWLWTSIGLAAAALTLTFVRGAGIIAARRRDQKTKPALTEAATKPAPRVRLPQIDTSTCLGCYACVDACPYDVLEIERYVAVVVRPEACCGLTLCEQRCPNGSLRVTDGEPIGDRPRLSEALESLDVPGLYLAGDLTGLPLIKNAILQGALAAERAAESLRKERDHEDALDLLIVGAGPAGISAALRAKELNLSFEVIEQGSVAQSIRSFPRGKLVFDQPLELPVTGKLWLKESTKEELLSHWLRIVRKERLPILEETRMTRLERDPERDPERSGARGLFRVITEPREGGPARERRAKRVILAIGQRGTPRRLGCELSPEVESKVHYHLADARSFEGQRVVVVGLGDVAMEAAIALSRQPSTEVTIVHRGEGFSRGKSRNIAETRRLIESGRVRAHFGATIEAVSPDRVALSIPRGRLELLCDAVLVMIGSVPPKDVLRQAGIKTLAEAEASKTRLPVVTP